MDWEHMPTWVRMLSQAAAAVTATAILWPLLKKIIRAVKGCLLEVRYMITQRRLHQELDAKLNMILAEVKPNGGTSMKDALNRLERNVDFVASFQRAQNSRSKKPMVQTDPAGRVIWANGAFVQLVGQPERALLGTGWVNIIAPEERDRTEENWEHIVEEGRELDEIQTYIGPDGKRFRVHVRAHPIMGMNNNLYGYLAEVTKAQND